MKNLSKIVLLLAFLGSMAVVVLSVWPGVAAYIGGFLTSTLVFWLPLVGAIGLLLMFSLGRLSIRNPKWAMMATVRFAVAGAFIVGAYLAVTFSIPQRVVFPIFKGSFDKVVNSDELSKNKEGELNRIVGIWSVDKYGTDRRGGVYFRTTTVTNGMDQVSYGFVYKPNTDGTPFGNAEYLTRRLAKDWYSFCASNKH